MNSDQFNRAVSGLSQGEKIVIATIIGKRVSGYFLRATQASRLDGSLEIETNKGIERFLSSAIDSIETSEQVG